jgi:GT2 family glycosyltransferase
MSEIGFKNTGACPPPELICELPAMELACGEQNVGFTVINYNTSAQTLRCVESLANCTPPPAWICVLDNASRDADFDKLAVGLRGAAKSAIQLFRSTVNLGFAAGSNFLIDQLLGIPGCSYIGLLNNDAVAMPELVSLLSAALAETDQPIGMSGGRMHKLHIPQEVDTLGISLYASLMPADRKIVLDPYLGPTGGCCMMTRVFLQDVKAATGYWFDERFFCYCEDTDLALRANLLGYKPAYVDELVALHEGQASSRVQHNDFIAYHGLRNLLWMQWKFLPTRVLIKNCFWFLLAHLLNAIKYAATGRTGVLFAVYRAAIEQRSTMMQERARFQGIVKGIPQAVLTNAISRRFYRKGYIRLVLSEWLKH